MAEWMINDGFVPEWMRGRVDGWMEGRMNGCRGGPAKCLVNVVISSQK